MEQTTQQPPVTASSPTQSQQIQTPAPVSQVSETNEPVKPKKGWLKWVLIGLVSLLILAGIYYWIF